MHNVHLIGVVLPFAVDEVHIADDGVSTAGHVTTDGPYCSCLPVAMHGAICRDGRVQVRGIVEVDRPLVTVYVHRNASPA
jgi:hypothetical protein